MLPWFLSVSMYAVTPRRISVGQCFCFSSVKHGMQRSTAEICAPGVPLAKGLSRVGYSVKQGRVAINRKGEFSFCRRFPSQQKSCGAALPKSVAKKTHAGKSANQQQRNLYEERRHAVLVVSPSLRNQKRTRGCAGGGGGSTTRHSFIKKPLRRPPRLPVSKLFLFLDAHAQLEKATSRACKRTSPQPRCASF